MATQARNADCTRGKSVCNSGHDFNSLFGKTRSREGFCQSTWKNEEQRRIPTVYVEERGAEKGTDPTLTSRTRRRCIRRHACSGGELRGGLRAHLANSRAAGPAELMFCSMTSVIRPAFCPSDWPRPERAALLLARATRQATITADFKLVAPPSHADSLAGCLYRSLTPSALRHLPFAGRQSARLGPREVQAVRMCGVGGARL